MATAINLGFPRISADREIKKALETYWPGNASPGELPATEKRIRLAAWEAQRAAGIAQAPTGDFSLYDHVLDTAFTFNLIPKRFRDLALPGDLDLYFAMARGGSSMTAFESRWVLAAARF